ncbi:hypothetical protein HDV03_005460 [Kappamyces sp. JEL0829]|nr:hypothetical protein HDV03_005460 [Kappamyces sp. JEL0829]
MPSTDSPLPTSNSPAVSPEFSSDFIASIDEILAGQAGEKPQDKLCFLWVKSRTGPKLVCFRKVISQDRMEEIEMISSHSQGAFQAILNGQATSEKWKPVQPPLRIKERLSPMLIGRHRPLTTTQVVARIWSPYGKVLARYKESWENGKSVAVLGKIVSAVRDGVPLQLMGKMYQKLHSWIVPKSS